MQRKLSFHIERDSQIHDLNPLTKVSMVFGLIMLGFFGPGYWLPSALLLLVIVPLSIVGKVAGEFLRAVVRLLLPVVGFMFVMQSLFLPGGKREIFHFLFLNATRESVGAAFLTSMKIMVMVASFILFLLTTHPSALMSDLRLRGFPGTLAYVISSTLQILPQMQAKAATIIDAQRSRGLETEGRLRKRIGALLPLIGPLVFGSLVDVEERAIAIEARGFTSSGEKSSLYDLTDSTADRVIRWMILLMVMFAIGIRLWLS